jgi:hypothetical protein
MICAANQKAIEDAGLSFILGARIPDVPFVVAQWRREHPGHDISDGHIFVQSWPAGPADRRRDQVIYYQYRAERARRASRGIDEQVAKAEKAVAGQTAVKRNRFVQLTGGTRTVNRTLEAKARALAGIKGYVTNLDACPDGTPITAQFVIDAYHQLFQIEKSFRMSKHDLQARPIYHHQRDSIDAHLTVVFAALAVSRWIEHCTGWSIKKFVRTARRYRTIEIQAGEHTITAADPLPDDLRQALDRINEQRRAHELGSSQEHGPPFEDLRRRDIALGQPTGREQLAQQLRVGLVSLGPPLRTAQPRRFRRLGQMRCHAGLGHLLGDVPPAGAAFHRERHRPAGRFELGEPVGQVFPVGRADPAAFPFPVLLVDPVECQLLPVDVGSDRDALPGLLPVGFPGPPAEPAVRLVTATGSPRVLTVGQPLLAAAGVGVHGVAMLLPR